MISDFFAKICCKHLTKRLNFATILVACGWAHFFVRLFCGRFPSQYYVALAFSLGHLHKVNSRRESRALLVLLGTFPQKLRKKISFAILCRACVFPRYFAQSARAPHRRKLSASRASFSRRTFTRVNSRRESRALLVLLGTFPQKPRKKISFAIPCRAYYIYRYGASAGQTMFLISVFYGLRIFRNLTRR